MQVTIEDYRKLTGEVERLQTQTARLEERRERAQREIADAEKDLKRLGFDAKGDVSGQLGELRDEIAAKVTALRKELDAGRD